MGDPIYSFFAQFTTVIIIILICALIYFETKSDNTFDSLYKICENDTKIINKERYAYYKTIRYSISSFILVFSLISVGFINKSYPDTKWIGKIN